MTTTVHIDEYGGKAVAYSRTHGKSPDTVYPKRVTTQPKLTVSGTSQQSAAVNVATSFVSVRVVGGAVYVEIGTSPTATANSKYLADGNVYDAAVSPGDKVAVISAA